jgi:precorrin-4/cobalt-precorrin-4 C11-methyltransferase
MIYIIGIGPGGSAQYMSARAVELCRQVDEAIYVGEMIGPQIRGMFPPDILTTGRIPLEEVSRRLEVAAEQGKKLAILVPGDPSLYSGQHGREKSVGQYIRWLRTKGVPFEIVPGISSWMALCAVAGIDMTEFGTSQVILVLSLERIRDVSADKKLDWEALGRACEKKPALVLFQSYAERASLPAFLGNIYPPESEVIVGYKVSWPDEKILRMPLSSFVQQQLGDELAKHSMIIILPPIPTL